MKLSFKDCNVIIREKQISCLVYVGRQKRHLQFTLHDNLISTKLDDKKETHFTVDTIKEFQFDLNNGGREPGPVANAYIITKSEQEPLPFFRIQIGEEYIFFNKTQTYHFCLSILDHIGQRYNIPVVYKMSVDTKKKRNAVYWGILALVLSSVILYLRFKYHF